MQLTEQPPTTTKTMAALPILAQAYFDELTETVRGEVYRRGDHQFVLRASVAIFCTHFSTQVSRAYTLIQWKRSEHLQGRCTSP